MENEILRQTLAAHDKALSEKMTVFSDGKSYPECTQCLGDYDCSQNCANNAYQDGKKAQLSQDQKIRGGMK